MRRVVVTSMGAITPLGANVESSWEGALQGRSGVRRIDVFDPTGLKTQIAGVVTDLEPAPVLSEEPGLPSNNRRLRLLLVAAREALGEVDWSDLATEPGRVGISLAANETHFYPAVHGPLFAGAYDGERFDESALALRTLETQGPGEMLYQESYQSANLLSRIYGVHGPVVSFLTACAAGTQALGEGARMIRRGAVDLCIAGGTDSMYNPLMIIGFTNLRALSRRNDDPERASRPFDLNRDGFVIGEGAAILLLEEYEHARRRGARILAEVAGYGVELDAWHLTANSPDATGPTNAMSRALVDARLAPDRIGYINAHGTSTVENDAAETLAIKRVFGDHAPRLPISSTKSMTGHLVASAGAVEAVFTILSLIQQMAPPTINYETPDPACDLDYVPNEARPIEAEYALSNSFGFGGQNTSVILKRLSENP